ncbi:MAG: endonuclease domain-containing protein [Candidatus Kerfeldbacteria bacterium]|nr:endonuclease domain-containing protein [Candidatus Kerfeldbacteria bacterium]
MPPRFLYNDPSFKRRRQKLRNESTPAERKLWGHLRKSQFLGLKFQRQYGIGPYVLDFFCPEMRLAIEVDGDSHFRPGARAYDRQRQKFIESEDITVVRFLNTDIHENIDGVLEQLHKVITNLCLPPTLGGRTHGKKP